MKAKRLALVVLVPAIAALLVAACSNPVSDIPRSGSLSIQLTDHINARTLVPAIDMTAASYAVSGSGPNGATFSQGATGSTLTVTNLAFGSWSVTVNALNAAGTIIGSGQSTATVSTGQTTTVDITVVPLSGNGTLSLAVSWTAAQVQSPSILATLTPPSGPATTPLSFSISGNQATYSSTTIPAGYQTLSLQLLDNGIAVMGAVEVVRIAAGQTTSGSYAFTNVNMPGGTISVNITPQMADPIPVSIAGVPSSISTGGSITAAASVGDTTPNVTFVWYLNGVSQATGQTYTLGSTLPAGYYRLDVTAFSADGTRGGSATSAFTVVSSGTPIAFASGDQYTFLTLPVNPDPNRVYSVARVAQSSLFNPATVTSISAYIRLHGSSTAFADAQVVNTGNATYNLQIRTASIPFSTTNPITFDVTLTVIAAGGTYQSDFAWSIGETPQRTAFMMINGVLYGKLQSELVYRPGASLYFGSPSQGIAYYAPLSSLSPTITQFSGPSTLPPPSQMWLLYFSVGNHYVNSFNESYFYLNQPLTMDSLPGYQAIAVTQFVELPSTVFFIDPTDVNGDGVIDWHDLEAVDLSSLTP